MQSHLLAGYSDREKSAYLGAVATVAMTDSQVNDEEIDFLRTLGEAAQLPADEIDRVIAAASQPSAAHLQRDLDALKGSELRYSLITDVVSFAKADGHFTTEEAEGISKMANYLGVNEAQFKAMAEFVDHSATPVGGGVNAIQPEQLNSSGFGDRFKQLGIPPGAMQALLTVAAPIVLRALFKNRSANNPMAGSGLGGLMGSQGGQGGGVAGGLLGQLLGGFGGGQAARTGGGLGSMASILSGGRGYRSSRGLLESVMGAVGAGPYNRR